MYKNDKILKEIMFCDAMNIIPKFIKKFRSSFIIDFKNNPNQFELPLHAMKEQWSTLKSFD